MYIGTRYGILAVNRLELLAPTSPCARFRVAGGMSSSSSSPCSSSGISRHQFLVDEVPEKSTGPRLSLSPSCCKACGETYVKLDSLIVNAAERYHGRQRSNTGIVALVTRTILL